MVTTRRLVVFFFMLAAFGCNQHAEVKLQTPTGPINGIQTDGVQRFLGIPYAETTAGDNRWRPPVQLAPWQDVFLANEFGPWCPQFDYERRDEGEVYSGEGWSIFRNVPPNELSDEDCLHLNVFTTPPTNTLKPVMVFLHGNALGSSFPMYDGTDVAKAGIVYVSINYRLHTMGIFAHPALTAEASADQPLGRYSEMDRLAALRWVQRNISAFGGDPNQVTLAGNSEGGAAILQLLGNENAEGLFHRAIVQSGNGWWEPLHHRQHEQLGCYLADLAKLDGCNATSIELRNLHWSAIPASGPYSIDHRGVKKGATQALETGQTFDVPLLIGWNDFDGSSLRYSAQEVIDHTHPDVLATYDTDQDSESLAYEIYTDLHSGAPARWVAHQLEDGKPVYLYLFSYVPSWDRDRVRGAEHGYELPHALATFEEQINDIFPFLAAYLLEDDDRAMTRIMHQCWMSFVKHGKPTCPNAPEWPRYRREHDQLMELNLTPKVRDGFRAAQLNAQERYKSHYLDQARESIQKLLEDGI